MQVTEHAKARIKERHGGKNSSLEKIAATALANGITHSETAGSLKRDLDKLFFKREVANNLRIWGDKVFIFQNEKLITVVQLPHKYMKICAQIKGKRGSST